MSRLAGLARHRLLVGSVPSIQTSVRCLVIPVHSHSASKKPVLTRPHTATQHSSYSSGTGSEHNPASLNLSSSAGSQAAQAATLGAMTAAGRDTSMDQYNAEGSGMKTEMSGAMAQGAALSTEETHRHEGNVSLHSAMQSSVPQPYEHDNRSPNHLNMPEGGHMQQVKMQASERFDANEEAAAGASLPPVPLTQRERLKKSVKEYGATVVVFHTAISLTTLGISYAAVSSGVDVVGLLAKLGVGQTILESKVATGTSTFVIAYAAHKVFAPARMAVTLTATPFIVHYLRRVGVLKAPTPKP